MIWMFLTYVQIVYVLNINKPMYDRFADIIIANSIPVIIADFIVSRAMITMIKRHKSQCGSTKCKYSDLRKIFV